MRIGNFRISWERLKNGTWLNYERNSLQASWSNDANLKMSLNNPVTGTLINIRADFLSKFNYFEIDDNGDKKEVSDFNTLIENPNPYQSKEDFIKEFEWLVLNFGWCYQLPYGATGLKTSYMYNLSPANITFNKQLKRSIIQKSSDVKELDKHSFTYKDLDTDLNLSLKEIIPFYDMANGLTGNPLTSPSRIDSIRKQTQNISIASDAQNIMTKTIGREMIYKEKQSNQMSNAMPLADSDKKDMESKFQNYGAGTGKNRTVVLNREMGWKALHSPNSDLGFEEIISLNANLIGQALQVPNSVYKAYMQGDTFENQNQGLLGFLQGTMQARADNLARSWGAFFGIKIKASCEHLPVMAQIEETKVDRVLKISQAHRNLTQSGLTLEQTNEYLINNGLKIIEDEN